MLDYPGPDDDALRGQWSAFEEMRKRGEAKSLAVSNFSPAQLDVVLAEAKKGAGDAARPTVNQLRLSPGEYGRAETARSRGPDHQVDSRSVVCAAHPAPAERTP